jgi:hypothetical protein
MSSPVRQNPKAPTPPPALHQYAEENLRFIRATMESATSFTGLSGIGFMLAGFSALAASWIAAQQPSDEAWLGVWMLELLLAASVCFGMTLRKAQQQGMPIWSASGRKLLLAFVPAMTAGGLLTLAFYLQGLVALLPGVWLVLYGAALATAGLWSVSLIPVMGVSFLIMGAGTLLGPLWLPWSPDLLLAAGFGGLHMIFGFIVWRYHGG